jgi:ubiquinone/menaquinone biosynthesis C-methylase UbiE
MTHDIQPHSNRVCPWWLAPTFDNPLRKWVHNPQEILSGLVASGQTVLDIGCGMGYFTIPLAKMVGDQGTVIAIDLQEKMLSRVKQRAQRAGVLDRIRFHHSQPTQLGLTSLADFALAFWMVHEVPDQLAFLHEVYQALKPGTSYLIAEPVIHVSAKAFSMTIEAARCAGFKPLREAKVNLSRAILLQT